MYTQNLENNTQFEVGRSYYYHFSCDYDSLSYMQIVSISDTRKTAVIQQLIGGKPYGEPKRKKIYVSGGVEHISAGNYSMAGVWCADRWDKSDLIKSLDLDFMYEHERTEALEALPEMPAAAPAGTVYTVTIGFVPYNTNDMVCRLYGVSLADMVNYISDNADAITAALGAYWQLDYILYENGEFIDDGLTAQTSCGDILREIERSIPEKYPAILAAISDPDDDPDPTEPTDKPDYTVPASPIDETAAKRGHEAYSFDDYKAGSATDAYNAAVGDVRAAAKAIWERLPEEYRGELDDLVDRYAAKLADWTNRKNRADASCPSWFITGAANYPHRKHEKQMRKLDGLYSEYNAIESLENRIRNFEYEIKRRPIKAGDASAADKLRAKVCELTALQEQMKRSNAEARKRGETAPYAAWALSNNRQNLKRYSDRLAALEKAKAEPTEQDDRIEGEGFRVVRNTEIMRLQFLFDGKPDEQTREILKSNGFRWAPSQMAWQRQLTANAERAARTVAEAIR